MRSSTDLFVDHMCVSIGMWSMHGCSQKELFLQLSLAFWPHNYALGYL